MECSLNTCTGDTPSLAPAPSDHGFPGQQRPVEALARSTDVSPRELPKEGRDARGECGLLPEPGHLLAISLSLNVLKYTSW